MTEQEPEWRAFVQSFPNSGVAASVIEFWDELQRRWPGHPLPVTSHNQSSVEIGWRFADDSYVGIWFDESGELGWLYRDSRNDVTDHEEEVAALPERFWAYMAPKPKPAGIE